MALDPQLLDILACPDTHHTPLDHDAAAQTLTCGECGRVFEVRDDVPVLLLSEATRPAGPAGSGPPAAGATGAGDPATETRSDDTRSDDTRSDDGEGEAR